jgi:hypothetical protein
MAARKRLSAAANCMFLAFAVATKANVGTLFHEIENLFRGWTICLVIEHVASDFCLR